MRNIFLEKSCKKCGGKTIHRPIFKKAKLSISLDRESKILQICFILCPNQGPPKYIKNKVFNTLFYLI